MKFAPGTTYYTRSIGDHNCIISLTIARRTARTVTTAGGKTYRIGAYAIDNAEFIRPWGSYSMAPILTAVDTKVLKTDWEA